jgi:hypothetical protein
MNEPHNYQFQLRLYQAGVDKKIGTSMTYDYFNVGLSKLDALFFATSC